MNTISHKTLRPQIATGFDTDTLGEHIVSDFILNQATRCHPRYGSHQIFAFKMDLYSWFESIAGQSEH